MPVASQKRWFYAGGLLAGAVIAAGSFFAVNTLHSSPAVEHGKASSSPDASAKSKVETVQPTQGGITRKTSQPGSAHSYESADLYAKVSGFLKTQLVDIGARVKKGDLLAEIDVPELVKEVESAQASHQQALAEVAQAQARVESAVADHQAALSRVAQAKADAERYDAEVAFGQSQYDRMKELHELKGVEERLVDEKLFQLQAAQANKRAAVSAVSAFEQQGAAASSRINLAKADSKVAEAKARVAEAQLDRAKVMVAYTRILSPYDGVVTTRNYHVGAFVRSAEQGGQVPILAVDRTDLMRVKVRIPEREIPHIQPGDRVAVRFDALPGKEFSGPVARIAESEDPATRTMLAEIDLENPNRQIRDHMYGRVDITLDQAVQGVTVPSACLVGDAADGQGQVFIVEGGRAKLRKVKLGRDTGAIVEVLSGLSTSDAVIIRPAGGLADGAEVVSNMPPGQAAAIAQK